LEAVEPLQEPRSGAGAGDIRATTLENGLRVLTERIEGVRSVAVGVWAAQGAVHEAPEWMGASHMLEHMVFKGTERRSARDIALSLESVGGSLDAYTSREHTSYQARVLDLHLPEAVDVLADLVRNPLLREEDLALEREVVLEEIAMVEDTPEDLVFDLHAEALWGDHPYGQPILGTRSSVSGLTSEGLRELRRDRYGAANLVVAAAGSLDHEAFLECVRRRFDDLEPGPGPTRWSPPSPTGAHRVHTDREAAQTHVVFGGPAPTHSDPRRHAVVLLSQALGGGMSSRLFQRVREELGLAYAVYSFHAFHGAAGVFGVYLGTRPRALAQAIEVVRAEMSRVSREGLPEDELARARAQVKGQVTLALESTGARLHRLAGSALRDEPLRSLDELLARYDGVTAEEVTAAAREFLDPERLTILSLGPDATGDGSGVIE
jgi:predicted Zn-dependent peptidase